MATIYDVAQKAKVSTYTVSAVLNRSAYVSPELTKRVQDAVRELDYTINELARGLQTRKSTTVGMLIPDIANPFYAKVVRGVENVLKQAGYSLILGDTNNRREEQSQYLALFRSKQVDGLLLFISPGDDQEVRALVKSKKPVVFVGRTPIDLRADSVSANNAKGVQMAAAHLVSKGHKRIALVNGQEGLSSSSDRVDGWRQGLKKGGLTATNDLLSHGDWTEEAGYSATLGFVDQQDPPTAIFAANFLMMTGVLKALKVRRLRCPQDVEVMSSDDSEWLDVFEPRISTIAQPSYEMGAKAAELVLKRIKSPNRRFEQIVLEPELMIR
jgi:LacI family transcriptional regulator, galactose operon repressor